jgi:hypothetical protein
MNGLSQYEPKPRHSRFEASHPSSISHLNGPACCRFDGRQQSGLLHGLLKARVDAGSSGVFARCLIAISSDQDCRNMTGHTGNTPV